MTLRNYFQSIIALLIQVFVIFPYSALTIRRQRQLRPVISKINSSNRAAITQSAPATARRAAAMISDKVYKLCTSKESVSALLAQDPTMVPAEAWKKLYGSHAAGRKESVGKATEHRDKATEEDLKRARECGNWGPTEPSELFLRLYHDALCTLDHSVSGCMVSPSLMGSCGVIPLTVISVVPDIMRHMSNLIVRAEKEVILATNYWQNSVASKYITNAMKELSRRAGERNEKIIFKLEYDRGSPKQLLENHYVVQEKEFTGKAVGIPHPSEIPNLDLQIINYHKPMLGTFHCKYMIVDRKYAVLQSNNIQDNDNVEMMIHLEGPVVDSMYDMALISWSKKLEPPLPSHNSPAAQGGLTTFSSSKHNDIFGTDGSIKGHSAVVHPEQMKEQKAYSYEPRDINLPGAVEPQVPNDTSDKNRTDPVTGPSSTNGVLHPVENYQSSDSGADQATRGVQQTSLHDNAQEGSQEESRQQSEDQKLPTTEILKENATAVSAGDTEHAVHTRHGDTDPKSSDNANPAPTGDHKPIIHTHRGDTKPTPHDTSAQSNLTNNTTAQSSGSTANHQPDTETQQFLGAGEQALPQSQIEHPSPESNLLPEHTTDDPHYDTDIAGEVARVQTAVSPKPGETRMEAITRHLNHTKNPGFKGTAPECAPHEEMTPYIPHPVHEPFPIAMVCREPHGTPNHHSVYNPQNEVWLSALRNAKKNVFIQSPTLNAEPLVPAIIEACERGVDVYCYICLGYNDTGELLPMQGGTNEMIAHKMYTTLSTAGKSKLHYFFYIGKDQTRPIVAKKKKRCCHVKVMIVDEHIGIQGNGNQDTQSWFHSQEINVMFDSAPVCRAWIDGLRRNQNTHLYGEVSKEDGVWRDDEGRQAEDVIGVDPGRFSWAKGFMGAINRVRGTGDF